EPPRKSNPAVPRDLELICLKCLEKEPHRRYPSGEALADKLERFLDGKPLAQTRPVSSAERVWRWCRRNPAFATLTAAVVALLLTVAGVYAVSYFQLRDANALEHASRVRAEENLRVAREAMAYFTKMSEDPLLKAHDLDEMRRDMWRQIKGFYEQL